MCGLFRNAAGAERSRGSWEGAGWPGAGAAAENADAWWPHTPIKQPRTETAATRSGNRRVGRQPGVAVRPATWGCMLRAKVVTVTKQTKALWLQYLARGRGFDPLYRPRAV